MGSDVEEPHQVISNVMVELYSGDDTVGEASWKMARPQNEEKLMLSRVKPQGCILFFIPDQFLYHK